jgi:hypothetical protein
MNEFDEPFVPTPIPADVLADLEAVCNSGANNTPLDPETARRVDERAAKARQQIADRPLDNFGTAVIREFRDAR